MNRAPAEEQAHKYADHGWFVFPTAPGSKIPVTEHGFLDASTDHKQIQQWWRSEPRSNVAIATGHPGPDVLDVDRHGDRSGYAAWNQLRQAGLAKDPQAIVKTPSGGMHAYFRGTQQRNGSLPKHSIDFRSQGGYVVAPPSQVGRQLYEVKAKAPSAATFDWNAAREHLDPQREKPAQRQPQRDAGKPRDVSHLADWVAAQPEGNRNQGLFWAANRAIEAGDTPTLDKLAGAARQSGLDQREVDRTIRSAQAATGGRPFEQSRTAQREVITARKPEPTREHAQQAARQHERQHTAARPTAPSVPSPRHDIERAATAATAAARAHKEPEHDREAGQ